MAVIINEFEIITTPPAPPDQNQAAQPPTPPPSSLRPEDIQRIMRHHRQRLERVRAN